jgi:hypothetical protein
LANPADSRAAPIALIGAALLLNTLILTSGLASPDGAAWETAETPNGCLMCHLDSPEISASEALTIEGLPKRPAAGERYELTIVLEDPTLRNAGFLLSIWADGTTTGELSANDDRVETQGAQARSTWDGSLPAAPGEARWQLVWTAPAVVDQPLSFDLWGNAGNDDLSPLGDRLHHRIWQLPPSQ